VEAALQEENERLRRELATERARRPRARRVRQTIVGVLLVLSCLGMLLSTLTDWTHYRFLNTDNWVALVTPLAHDPRVVEAVSAYAADQAVIALDVRARAQDALPPRAQFLAVPLTQVVRDFTQRTVARLMQTPKFEQVWIATNRTVHAAVLAALRGDTKNVVITNGVVTINLIPIIDQALQALADRLSGLLPAGVQLPDPSQLQLPEAARARLSHALGVQLPENFGQITLFQSDQLAKAQQLLRLFDFLAVALPILTAFLIAATIWFSLDRRRTLVQFGLGIAITFFIARLALGYLQGRVIDGINNPTAQAVAGDVITAAVSSLLTWTVLLLVAGVMMAVVAYLFGKPEWFRLAYAGGKTGYARARASLGRTRAELDLRRLRAPSQAPQPGSAAVLASPSRSTSSALPAESSATGNVVPPTTAEGKAPPGTDTMAARPDEDQDLPPGALAHGA
jgi:hypothetical protein